MLLNNLNLSTSYNLDADGVTNLALAPIRVSGGTQLFENKECEFWDHSRSYAIDTGNRINTFNNNGGSLF
jgi:hypothetical protein